jgi:hypothetical protein
MEYCISERKDRRQQKMKGFEKNFNCRCQRDKTSGEDGDRENLG